MGGSSSKEQGVIDNFHKKTETLGKPVVPSIEFDDYDFIKDYENYRLEKLKIWHTKQNIVGLQAYYNVSGKTITPSSHEGNYNGEVKCEVIQFSSDEYINQLEIGSDDIIKSIKIITNKNTGGKRFGKEQDKKHIKVFKLTPSNRFVSFGGSTGQFLLTLRANFDEIYK